MTMDPLLGGNYNDVPDKIPLISPAANVDMIVDSTDVKPNSAKTGTNLVVNFHRKDGPEEGRRGTLWIGLAMPSDQSNEAVERRIRTKQFFAACGVAAEPSGGFDRNKLKGGVFKCDVVSQIRTDAATQTQIEGRNFNVLKPDGSRF